MLCGSDGHCRWSLFQNFTMLDEEQRRQFIYPALHTHCNLLALRENMEQFSSSQVACIVLPSFIVIVKFISQKNSLN